MRNRIFFILFSFFLIACDTAEKETPVLDNLLIESITLNERPITNNGTLNNISITSPWVFEICFNKKVDATQLNKEYIYFTDPINREFTVTQGTTPYNILLTITENIRPFFSYRLYINEGLNLGGKLVNSYSYYLNTEIDETPKFPTITDEELLTKVQRQTFKYFYDYAHPVSGLARERLNSGDDVTSGGSGFGLMAILVGIERGFVTRDEGFALLNKIVNFLSRPETETFHGAFPHWLNGTTGKAKAFSTKDNGGDLVETAFLMQGLLAVKEYFAQGNAQEHAMCNKIETLWRNVEWDWYQQNGQSKLFWHWSREYGWQMNMQITGWNESLIVYVLAASSPTHGISKEVYDKGWARDGGMRNGRKFYDITLPLGEDKGGPLFFAHYSFMGLDPRNLKDQYAHYGEQNKAHAQINHAYCVANPKNYTGYSDNCWGLSASDIPDGYTASSPNNDRGTIAPTAALSSMPYTPEESLKALRYFYYILGDKLFGDYGFKDSFDLNRRWFASSYLAIDQGPIVVMIENYRSNLIWNIFMRNKDVQRGLNKLGFTY